MEFKYFFKQILFQVIKMKEQILEKLHELETSEDITILYAAESGSRSWGYANDESDYDIKFIYRHNDISRYLVLDTFKDVIQKESGCFDLMGWDIKKALHLHYKSNASIKEWMTSPIVYISDEIGLFRDLPQFNQVTLRSQYYGQALKTNKKYILGSDLREKKIVKKTLYVIRCNLTWMELGQNPPQVSDEVCNAISNLRDAYSNLTLDEISEEDLEVVHAWINDSLDNYEFEKPVSKAPKRDIEDYNIRFQEIIGLR